MADAKYVRTWFAEGWEGDDESLWMYPGLFEGTGLYDCSGTTKMLEMDGGEVWDVYCPAPYSEPRKGNKPVKFVLMSAAEIREAPPETKARADRRRAYYLANGQVIGKYQPI